jgi:hypothetical protein
MTDHGFIDCGCSGYFQVNHYLVARRWLDSDPNTNFVQPKVDVEFAGFVPPKGPDPPLDPPPGPIGTLKRCEDKNIPNYLDTSLQGVYGLSGGIKTKIDGFYYGGYWYYTQNSIVPFRDILVVGSMITVGCPKARTHPVIKAGVEWDAISIDTGDTPGSNDSRAALFGVNQSNDPDSALSLTMSGVAARQGGSMNNVENGLFIYPDRGAFENPNWQCKLSSGVGATDGSSSYLRENTSTFDPTPGGWDVSGATVKITEI